MTQSQRTQMTSPTLISGLRDDGTSQIDEIQATTFIDAAARYVRWGDSCELHPVRTVAQQCYPNLTS